MTALCDLLCHFNSQARARGSDGRGAHSRAVRPSLCGVKSFVTTRHWRVVMHTGSVLARSTGQVDERWR